jgi:hypothetical protein
MSQLSFTTNSLRDGFSQALFPRLRFVAQAVAIYCSLRSSSCLRSHRRRKRSRGVLRSDAGFTNAETVEALLQSQKLQEQVCGQVIWIDEAGLMGARALAREVALAEVRTVALSSIRVSWIGCQAAIYPALCIIAFQLPCPLSGMSKNAGSGLNWSCRQIFKFYV